MATKTFQNTQSAKPATRSELKIVYDQSKAADFTSELMNNNEVLHRLTDCVNNSTVDSIVNSFTEYMYATAARVFGRETQTSDRPQPNLSQNKWFDAECTNAKKDFKQARNVFLREKNVENRQRFVSTRTKYNRIKRKAKQKFKFQEGKNICNLAKKQPKKFWKTLKKKYKQKQKKIRNVDCRRFVESF